MKEGAQGKPRKKQFPSRRCFFLPKDPVPEDHFGRELSVLYSIFNILYP